MDEIQVKVDEFVGYGSAAWCYSMAKCVYHI